MKFLRTLTILFVFITLFLLRHDIIAVVQKGEILFHEIINGETASESVNGEISVEQDSLSTPTDSEEVLAVKNQKQFSQTPGPLRFIQNLGLTEKDVQLSVGEIINATNRERVLQGLSPLTENYFLDASALEKTKDMLLRQYFEHESPDGKDVTDLAKEAGYEFIVIGENLAVGNFENSDAVVQAWMNSPGHRANILNGRYTEIGIGVYPGIYKNNKVWFAVQHFGLSKSACPVVDETIKQKINNNKKRLSSIELQLTTLKGELANTKAMLSVEYAGKVVKYNTLVDEYNLVVASTKKLVDAYNEQVRLFNECAANS